MGFLAFSYLYTFLSYAAGHKWKKRWCVLNEGSFAYFRGKQDALKSGWLNKKGGGTGTLSRYEQVCIHIRPLFTYITRMMESYDL